jgi:HSP90 family molecular chaperone
MYKPLTDWWKKFLGADVEKVIVSNKLVDDPLFILTSQYGYSATMEKVNKAQAFQNNEKTNSYMLAKKTLEINPHHALMKELLKQVQEGEDVSEASQDYARLMFNMALLNSGFTIDEP